MKSFNERLSALTPEQRALFEKKAQALRPGTPAPRKGAEPIPRRNHSEPSPLSFDQERLWLFCRVHPESFAYNVYGSARVKGVFRPDALEYSINEVIKRHEAWRTVFDRNEPLQIVLPELRISVPIVDLRDAPEEHKEALVYDLMQEEVQRLFDLYEGPLVRFKFFRLSDTEGKLVITVHHMVTDKITFNIFYEEMMLYYNAYVQGRTVQLPELPVQYADYAEWQRNDLQGEKREKLVAFWKEQLRDSEFVLNMPTDFSRPPQMSFLGGRVAFRTPKPVTDRLIELAKQEGATPFMMLLTAFKALLFRYTGQLDILVGTPIANRNRTELERILGYFLTMGTLRSRITETMTTVELLRSVRLTAKDVFNHQELPVGLLLDELRIPNDPSRNPLVQAVFLYVTKEKFDMTGLDIEPELLDGETVRYDVTLCAVETDDGYELFFEYPLDLYRRETIERMSAHWNRLLESMAAAPHAPIGGLPMLTDAERQQLVTDWNRNERTYAGPFAIHERFERQAALTPDRPAVIFSETAVTYRSINERANQLARRLLAAGAGEGQLIGIFAERSVEMIVAIYAVLKTGAAYVPIDPEYPAERVRWILDDSEISLLLTYRQDSRGLFHGSMFDLESFFSSSGEELGACENLRLPSEPDHLAYVFYTSGTTGKPKGAQLPHRSIVNFLQGAKEQLGYADQKVILSVASISFDIFVMEVLLPLETGMTVVLANTAEQFDPAALNTLIARERVDFVQMTPSRMQLLVQENNCEALARLEAVMIGGEAFPEALLAWLRANTGARV